jgi:hypothetical protein
VKGRVGYVRAARVAELAHRSHLLKTRRICAVQPPPSRFGSSDAKHRLSMSPTLDGSGKRIETSFIVAAIPCDASTDGMMLPSPPLSNGGPASSAIG